MRFSEISIILHILTSIIIKNLIKSPQKILKFFQRQKKINKKKKNTLKKFLSFVLKIINTLLLTHYVKFTMNQNTQANISTENNKGNESLFDNYEFDIRSPNLDQYLSNLNFSYDDINIADCDYANNDFFSMSDELDEIINSNPTIPSDETQCNLDNEQNLSQFIMNISSSLISVDSPYIATANSEIIICDMLGVYMLKSSSIISQQNDFNLFSSIDSTQLNQQPQQNYFSSCSSVNGTSSDGSSINISNIIVTDNLQYQFQQQSFIGLDESFSDFNFN